jgi:hypothetical protein
MFSAVYFVAIGMLIDPKGFTRDLWPILICTGIVLLGKLITCSAGAFVAGSDTKNSLRIGMAMGQIGEFSFIIAQLGLTLHSASEPGSHLGVLYPVAVYVSVITTMLTPYRIRAIERHGDALQVTGEIRGERRGIDVDEVIACTGFRPDLDMLREVRLSLDPWLECATALGPLIDPNEHSCGTVRPHGARELAHPEKDFYIVGMKSYGRAPTFLLATGYEQARSVVAMLAGDVAAAERVELVLPETGVCSTDLSAGTGGCCGGPAPEEANACCVDDAVAKAEGKGGCGCGTPEPALLQIGVPSKA